MENFKYFCVTFLTTFHLATALDKCDKFRSFLYNVEDLHRNLKESTDLIVNFKQLMKCNETNQAQQEQINEMNQTISNLKHKLKGMKRCESWHLESELRGHPGVQQHYGAT